MIKKQPKFIIDISFISRVVTVILILFIGAFAEQRFRFLERYSRVLPNAVSSSDETQLTRLVNASTPTNRSDVDFEIFWEVWNLLERDYVYQDKIDATKMVDGAIEIGRAHV